MAWGTALGLGKTINALGQLRAGRLVREVRGLRLAVEALVALKAQEIGVANPLAPAVRKLKADLDAETPPRIDPIDDNPGNYVQAELRRTAYEQARGRTAPLDEDFMSPPREDEDGDQVARAVSVTVYPEDRGGFR